MADYYVYIVASRSRTLYVGVTRDLLRRVYQHKHKLLDGYTARYNISRLIFFERTDDVRAAIRREKQLKGWVRDRKLALIEELNPTWKDLSEGWYETADPSLRSG